MNLEAYLKIAVHAALEAGAKIMEIYDAVIEVEYKDDKSPLTQADKEANTIINNYLIPTKIPIISEENKQIDFETRRQWDLCWIVDPVDGTKEFIKRNGEFTVNIALIDNGKPILGVIYVPALKELYVADNSKKIAFKSILSEHQSSFESVQKRKLKILPKAPTDLIQIVGSRSHMSQETVDYIESIKKDNTTVEIVSKGSSLKFCLVAQGLADVYPRFAPTMEWDTAAGQAICEAVGLEVISNETKAPLLYNKENLLNPWFIVQPQ
jgi:3'(2'), 5'-bisphosphate nucleotidase